MVLRIKCKTRESNQKGQKQVWNTMGGKVIKMETQQRDRRNNNGWDWQQQPDSVILESISKACKSTCAHMAFLSSCIECTLERTVVQILKEGCVQGGGNRLLAWSFKVWQKIRLRKWNRNKFQIIDTVVFSED